MVIKVDILFNSCSRPFVYISTNESEGARYNKMASARYSDTCLCVNILI